MPHALQDRDRDALRLIARFRMLTRPQLRRARFADRSETVVKRSVDRLVAVRYLGAERPWKTGYQVLWCTPRGRDFLLDEGFNAQELFPARGPAAAKDFKHTLRIVDTAVALFARGWDADAVFPAWALQRSFGAQLRAVPDLLALDRGTVERRPVALAVEVDLAGEALTVFLPKLRVLAEWLGGYSAASVAAVLIVTTTARRRDAIAARIAASPLAVAASVECIDAFTAPHPLKSHEGPTR